MRFSRHEGRRRSPRLSAGRAGALWFPRDSRGLDVDRYCDDDAGVLFSAGDALDRKCEFRRSGDGVELRGGRHWGDVVLTRTNQPAALAWRIDRMRRGDSRVAQQALGRQFRLASLRLPRVYLRGLSNLDGGAETLIVRVFNGNPNAHIRPRLEVQYVVRARIRREPEVAFDIFPKSLERWKGLIFLFFQQTRGFSPGLDNLKVLVVHPDAPLKVALALFHF